MWLVLRCLVEEVLAVCQVMLRTAGCRGERRFDAFRVGHFQSPIHLVGRDVVEAFAFVSLWQAFPIKLGGLEEGERSHDVRTSECEGVLYGAVHVALCCEVDDAVDLLVLHQFVEGIEVADVHLHELVVGLVLNVFQVREVACVGQLVEVDDLVLGVLVDEEAYYVTADETGSTSYDDVEFHNYIRSVNGLSKSFRLICLVSFSLRIDFSMGIRQSMPRLRSVMAIPSSASGW